MSTTGLPKMSPHSAKPRFDVRIFNGRPESQRDQRTNARYGYQQPRSLVLPRLLRDNAIIAREHLLVRQHGLSSRSSRYTSVASFSPGTDAANSRSRSTKVFRSV